MIILQHPYLVVAILVGAFLLVTVVLRRVRLIYRVIVALVLCAVATPFLPESTQRGGDDFLTVDTIRIIETDLRILADWRRETGKYPLPETGGLTELMPFSRAVYFHDAWKRELRYELTNGVPRITSAGPDGRFGTEDDIAR